MAAPPQATVALREAYVDLILLAGRMRDGDLGGAKGPALRAHADGELRRARKQLLAVGVDEEVLADAQLPIIGLLDESAQASRSPELKAVWAPLQYEWYGHNECGTKVFDRLAVLRNAPRGPVPVELLEVYARCLEWGFQGTYAATGRLDDLAQLREGLHLELQDRLGSGPAFVALLADVVALPMPPPLLGPAWTAAIAVALLSLTEDGVTFALRARAQETIGEVHRHGEALAPETSSDREGR